VLIDIGCWIAISLARWAPVIAAGALVGWLVHHLGAQSLDALGIDLLLSQAARHLMRRRVMSDDGEFT
jgi:uncharacterized membrane protein YfcA